jgi:lipopolysaccharide export system protein LptC
MSELAERDRRVKRRWAIPGGSHDRIVKIMKLALPALIGVILAFLFFAPLEDKQEVSFLLKKEEVEKAPERLRVAAAQYRGQDDQGRPFLLSARSALQETSANPVVEISDMNARIQLDNGPALLNAGRARYNMDTDHVEVVGPIQFTAADGYRMGTRDVNVDLRGQHLVSRGPVEGQMPLGNFRADQLQVNLRDRTVVLTGRAHLRMNPGRVR